MKRFFLSILLILVDSGTAQIAFFIILNGLSLTYCAILRPYKKVFYNIILLANEAVFLCIGFFMIAFLETQKDFSVLGIVLIALLTVNLIGLFVVSSVYELINLIKFIKSKRSVLRSDMRVVKPKITKRVELNRRKLPDALPQIDERYKKLEKSENTSDNMTNKFKSIEASEPSKNQQVEYHPLDNVNKANNEQNDEEYNQPKQNVFYCPPIEIRKKVDPTMFRGFEVDLDFEEEIKPKFKAKIRFNFGD